MTARIISPGLGDQRALVVGYRVPVAQPHGRPHLDDQIRDALPGACIIVYDGADGEPLLTTELRARDVGWAGGPLVLIGYSAGCLRGVRQRLLEGADPSVVVAIDGTHAGLPPQRWQIDVWRRMFDDARAGRRLFVATHSMQTYVEAHGASRRYQATVTTLRQVTGWPLARAGALPLGTETSFGDAHIHSYGSAPIDSAAHSEQLLTVLPEMLGRHVAPWLWRQAGSTRSTTPAPMTLPTGSPRALCGGERGPDVGAWQERLHELGYDPGAVDDDFGPVTEAATLAFQRASGILVDGIVGPETRAAAARAPSAPPDRPTVDWVSGLGAALLEQAQADLRAGVREEWGSNDGRRIREYLAGTGAPPGSAWCAAAVRRWLLDAAAALDVQPPIQGSVGAKATGKQLERAGRWLHVEALRAAPAKLRMGMVVVCHRGAPGAVTGHIGVVSRVDGGRFHSIEANSGAASDRVAERPHLLDEAHLLGAGFVD